MCTNVPPAPDPTQTIAAQSTANTTAANQNAELNRVNQNTPLGSLTYTQSGNYPDGTADYTQNVSLSPQEQQIFDNQTQGQINLGNTALGMQGQVAGSYASPIDTSGAPGINSTGGSTTGINGQINTSGLPGIQGSVNGANNPQAIQQAEDAAYKGQTQYLDPQFAQSQEALDSQLANEGITQGSQAYTTAQNNLALQKQQAYGNAGMQAVTSGQNEQNTLFGQNVQAGDFANTAQAQGFGQAATQQQAGNQAQQQEFGEQSTNAQTQNQAETQYMQELFALRNQPLNEYNSLMTGAQVQSPTFSNVPQANVATTDVGGITNSGYQSQLAAYNASNQGINNLFSLGGSLGSAAILSSDRRLKCDIARVGETGSGIPIYDFRYIKDGEVGPVYRGVMADEVAPKFPDAVLYDDSGFAMVDYGRIQ